MLRPLGGPSLTTGTRLLREPLDRQQQHCHFQASHAVRLESGVPVISSSRSSKGRLRNGPGVDSSAPSAAGDSCSSSAAAAAAPAAAAIQAHTSGELLFVYCPPSGGHAAASISGGALGGRLGRAWAATLVCPRALKALPEGARRFIAGGISAAVAKTALAPIEGVRLRVMQSGGTRPLQAAAAIYRSGGIRGFMAGNSLDVLRTVPSKAIELAAFDTIKAAMFRYNERAPPGAPRVPDRAVATVAGAIAGVIATLVIFPLEVTRTRMVVDSGAAAYRGALDCAVQLARREGPLAFYKGLQPTLLGIVPYAGIRLGLYDGLKRAHKRATGADHIGPQAALVFGAVAGVASAVATFPLEVARRRMMAGAAFPNTAAALATIAAQEGPAALFNGVGLSLLKQGPQYAIGFASYEVAKRWLDL